MNNLDDIVFRPTRPGIRKVLGNLEAEIMEIIWQWPGDEGVSVRDIYEALRTRRPLAYTTIMTTMSRLGKKGLLSVDKIDQTYIYRPRLAKKDFTEGLVGRLLDSLLFDFSGAALSYFLSSTDDADKEEIERMLLVIERRRKQGNRNQPDSI